MHRVWSPSRRTRYTWPVAVPATISALSGEKDMATTGPSRRHCCLSTYVLSKVVMVPSPPPQMTPSGHDRRERMPSRHAGTVRASFERRTPMSPKSPEVVPQ